MCFVWTVPAELSQFPSAEWFYPQERHLGKLAPLEICCGHVGLAAALHRRGVAAKGLDWGGGRTQVCVPKHPSVFTILRGQYFVEEMFYKFSSVFTHMVPPCDAMSRPRDK